MKDTFKLLLSSLFKNDAAIEGRKKPWFIALIIFLLSTVLAVIPMTVSVAKTTGSDFFESTLYSYEIGVQKFSETLDDQNVDIAVTANAEELHVLSLTGDWSTVTVVGEDYFEYVSPTTTHTVLRVYLQNTLTTTETEAFVTELLALENTEETPNLEITSFLVLGNRAMYSYLYNPADVAAGTISGDGYTASYKGNYTNVEVGTNFRNFAKYDVSGDVIASPTEANYASYQAKVMANWEKLYDNAYSEIKDTLLWTTSGIMLGVDAIIGLFMMLMIFILTRGKNNPNHTFTVLDSIKIGSWSMLSPALISLILGFLFTSYASMIFVMTIGLRVMWMSMKSLRPTPVAPQPPVRK